MRLWWKAFLYTLRSFWDDYEDPCIFVVVSFYTIVAFCAAAHVWARIILIVTVICIIIGVIIRIYNYFIAHMRKYIQDHKRNR